MSRVRKKKTEAIFSRIGLKLIIPYLVISFFTLILITGLIYYNFKVQTTSIQKIQEEISIKASSEINYYVENIMKELSLVNKNILCVECARESNREIIKSLINEDPSIYEIAIVGGEGKEITKIVRHAIKASSELEDISTQGKFKKAIEGNYYLGPVYLSEYGIPFISMSLPITDKHNTKIGVLSAEVDLSPMWDTISKIKVKKTGYVYVVDQNGTLIAYKNINLIKKNLDLKHILGVENFLNNIHRPATYASFNNEKVIGNWKSMEVTGWGVIVELPIKEVFQELSVLFFIAGISIILFVLFIFIILIIIFKRLLMPISYLQEGVTEVKKGNLNYKMNVVSKDEIGELAVSFNQMVEDLQKTTVSINVLQEEQGRFQDVVASTGDWIWEVDAQGRYIYCSPMVERILGYKTEEVAGKYFYDFFHPDEREELKKQAFEVFAKKGVFKNFLNRNIRKDGQAVILETSGVPVLDEDGSLLGYRGADRDITERKRVEIALQESKQRLADIINFSPDPTFVIDIESRVIAWNRAIEEMTGIKAEDILGKGNYEYSLPFYGERRPILIDLVIKSDLGIEKKYTFIEKDKDVLITEIFLPNLRGKGVFVWGKAAPLFDADGKVIGAIETIRDIAERKKIEEQQRELMKDLEETNKIMVGRELKMIELKKEINRLSRQLGNPEPYDLAFLE